MSYVPSAPPVGDEIFLLKMGEMVLKGLNRRTFEERLMGNARRRLQKYGKFRIYSRQSITYVEPKEAGCDMDGAFATLSRLFGVVGLSRAKACEKTPEAILETAKTYLHDDLMAARTFKVESKRADKTFPMTSIQLSQYVGGELNEAFPHIQADVHHPELTVHVEVRDYAAYVHGDPAPGAGGLPVGVGGQGGLPPVRGHRQPRGLLDDGQAGGGPGDGPLLQLPLHLPRGQGEGPAPWPSS